MAKRLSDTDVIAATPIGTPGQNESVSMSVRRIDNGFVTCESRCGPQGYTSTERYSQNKPQLGELMSGPGVVGEENLRGTKAALRTR